MLKFLKNLLLGSKVSNNRSYSICKMCGKDVPANRFCQCFCSDMCEQIAHSDGVMGPICDC